MRGLGVRSKGGGEVFISTYYCFFIFFMCQGDLYLGLFGFDFKIGRDFMGGSVEMISQ